MRDRHCLRAAEVEPHSIGGDQRAFLVGLRVEDPPEGKVEDVGAGVVLHHGLPPLLVQLKCVTTWLNGMQKKIFAIKIQFEYANLD